MLSLLKLPTPTEESAVLVTKAKALINKQHRAAQTQWSLMVVYYKMHMKIILDE